MNSKWNYWVAAAGLGMLVLAGTGCQKLRARDQLNKGVQAFRSAKYPEAVERFKTAVELDPEFHVARLYLATAYMSQYIPGAPSPENTQVAEAAKQNFLLVLKQDPKNAVAVESMASLNYNEAAGITKPEEKLAKFDEAGKWYTDLARIDPNRKEAFYSLGVIAWAKWYPAIGTARIAAGMKPEDPPPLKDKKLRDELRAKYWGVIDDGIKNLQRALEIDKGYDDAMAYLNLLYRERADLGETPAECKSDIDAADRWLQEALATRKSKAAGAPGMGTEPAK